MNKRFIAHVVIEAQTPLKVGSSKSDFLQDSPIQKDWNDLPMILGTSIAGVLRKEFDEKEANELFGSDEGSKVIFSNALFVNSDGKVHEELLLEKNDFLKRFEILPIREHAAITDKGVAKEHSKFDEEVVYKGARFKFSIEMVGDEKAQWEKLLSCLYDASFRIGGGSTKGFGKVKVVALDTLECDATDDAYLKLSSSLNEKIDGAFTPKEVDKKHTIYTLELQPDNFFLFGSGFGDDAADDTPVYEQVIEWDERGARLSQEKILIPASSLKGAIAHRTTYHYNLLEKRFIGREKKPKESVEELFGKKKDKGDEGFKGKVLFSDVYLKKGGEKVFDHVAIDRFTGGAIEGALFQEKTTTYDGSFEIEILVENGVNEKALKAFEKTLDDICKGMLPLGGAVNKGHGVFLGKWSKQ